MEYRENDLQIKYAETVLYNINDSSSELLNKELFLLAGVTHGLDKDTVEVILDIAAEESNCVHWSESPEYVREEFMNILELNEFSNEKNKRFNPVSIPVVVLHNSLFENTVKKIQETSQPNFNVTETEFMDTLLMLSYLHGQSRITSLTNYLTAVDNVMKIKSMSGKQEYKDFYSNRATISLAFIELLPK